VAVREAQFQSVFDARQDVQHHFRALGVLPSSKGKKTQLDFDEKVDLELKKRLDSTDLAASILHGLEHNYSDAATAFTGQVLFSVR
jgi:hypothetical protein